MKFLTLILVFVTLWIVIATREEVSDVRRSCWQVITP